MQVMIDRDLAELYEVEPKRLNEQDLKSFLKLENTGEEDTWQKMVCLFTS